MASIATTMVLVANSGRWSAEPHLLLGLHVAPLISGQEGAAMTSQPDVVGHSFSCGDYRAGPDRDAHGDRQGDANRGTVTHPAPTPPLPTPPGKPDRDEVRGTAEPPSPTAAGATDSVRTTPTPASPLVTHLPSTGSQPGGRTSMPFVLMLLTTLLLLLAGIRLRTRDRA